MHLLLLDEGFMSGAVTAIGLRDAGCRVTVLAAVGGRGRCRAPSLDWRLAPRVDDGDALARAVAAQVARDPEMLVLPLTEPLREWAYEQSYDWARRLRPALAPWQRALLASKRAMSAHVGAQGVSVPEECDAALDDSVREAARGLGLPLVLKGTRGRGGSTTRIVSTLDDALRAARALRPRAPELFAQRHVDGDTYLVGGLFDGGRPLRLYAGRKLALRPARTGPAIRIRSVREPALVDLALRAFAALEITGLASADFVRDGDGRFHFLEINARPWGSIAAAAEAGVALFAPYAALLAGDRVAPRLDWREGVESTVFPLYLAAGSEWRGLGAATRTVRDLARDLCGAQGAPWREIGQGAHLLHRLTRVAANWP